ncbi:HET-domain-containing protein [Mytilinidion resinicola]|uniref:HET-domain-containing protein n=1 Tax=Mytilinidion resinicola TaxID=574789 RepID=A0A6A6Y7Q5_9PEZI|nr:HET-domain-containing protein [Mytilinidion resinicola]KAF2804856.1 HET-domain-containing protein [Mytilinidion resinicola]
MASQSRKRKRAQTDHADPFANKDGPSRSDWPPFGNETSLCARCESVGLRDIFTKGATGKVGTFIADIGQITRDWLDKTCPFCQFLAQIVFSSGNGNLKEDIEYSLRAFPSITALGHIINDRNSRFMPKTNNTAVLSLVKSEKSNSQRPQLLSKEVLNQWGYIYSDTVMNLALHPRILGRVLKPDFIDTSILRGWMNFCITRHISTCKILEETSIPSLRVIDCFSRKVVEAPVDCRYVAMSYVWGQRGKNADWNLSSTSNALPEELPAVIEDAIFVVKHLGLRFLWIDRYCIIQDNKEDVIRHMGVMDLIYNHAFVTIVAAAGSDPFYGLPGVGSRARSPQPSAVIGTQTLVSTLPDPQEQVKSSTWMTRAWVYQEALFSIRRLIFTDYQVYFECNNMHCCEAIDLPLEAFHTKDHRRFRTCVRHGVFRGGFGKRCWPLTSHIQKYTEKSLTYQSDVLRGMLGIFRAFERAKYPIHHVWGVPIEFDMDLIIWKKQATMSRQYSSYPWKLSASFARGLCWLPKHPAARRPEFPSWSWTGWAGPIQDWPSFETLSAQENPDIQIRVTLEDGRVANLQDLYSFTGSKTTISKTSCFLEVESWTFQINIVCALKNGVLPSAADDMESASDMCEYYAKVNLEDGTTIYSPLLLCREIQHGDDFSKTLISCKWDCIILGYRKQASRSPMVMVLEKSEDAVERIGLVDFWSSCTDTNDPKSAIVFDDRRLSKAKRKIKLK